MSERLKRRVEEGIEITTWQTGRKNTYLRVPGSFDFVRIAKNKSGTRFLIHYKGEYIGWSKSLQQAIERGKALLT